MDALVDLVRDTSDMHAAYKHKAVVAYEDCPIGIKQTKVKITNQNTG